MYREDLVKVLNFWFLLVDGLDFAFEYLSLRIEVAFTKYLM